MIFRRLLLFALCITWRAPLSAVEMKLSPSAQITYATVRIECTLADGSKASGTGFFYQCLKDDRIGSSVPVIVTNKHVVKGAVSGGFYMHLADEKGDPLPDKNIPVVLDNFEGRWIPHPDGKTDLCVLPIAPILDDAKSKNIRPFYVSLDKTLLADDSELAELDAYERILMVGYPIGIWDSVNNMPLFRAGVTSTAPSRDYEGRAEFVIDAACFPGSSGSPVLLWDNGPYMKKTGETVMGGYRIKLLGVLYAGPVQTMQGEIQIVTIPTKQVPMALTKAPVNLGFVIKAKKIQEFDPVLEKLISKSPSK